VNASASRRVARQLRGQSMPDSKGWLQDLKVLDLGFGMPAALAAKFLTESGAEVTRVEPVGGDPFYGVYPAYEHWRRGEVIDHEAARSQERLQMRLAEADVCITGGEDHPDVERRRDATELHRRHPRLVVLDIEGYPTSSEHSGRPATDVLVQARSGLAYEHYRDRPLLMSFEPSNYGATLQGLAGLFGALYQREATGRGQVVSTSLYEGALAWTLYLWVEGERPTPGFSFVMPKSPVPLIFRCADGVYVQVVLGSAGSKYHLYRILGIDDPSVGVNDSGMPKPTADVRNFFGDVDLLASYVEKRGSSELLDAIWAVGMPAEPVLLPGACWDDAQVATNDVLVTDAARVRRVGHPIQADASPAARTPARSSGDAPLAGVRVIDFGAFVAGPYASVILADLGADVIKVEAMTGDPNRSVFRSYASVNRGKRAIKLDLKSPEGREIAQRLCLSAAVITSNFRAGVSARLGIDARTLHAMKPQLIVLESAAYGTAGPKRDRAGFDMCFQALCGHDWRGGGAGNPPLWNRTSMVDYAAGALGAVAVLRHLYTRARRGEGAELGMSLLNAGIYLLSELIQKPDGSFAGAPALNQDQTGYHPAERMYEAADAWVAIVARGDASSHQLVQVLGLGDAVKRARAQWDEAEGHSIAAAVRKRAASELCAALERAGVWAEVCKQDVERAVLNDPKLVASGTVYQSEHPQFGHMRQIGPLFRLSAAPNSASAHSALPGEHTREVLEELAYDTADIESLIERKVAG
jgi:crotonobetainyl-CoA:carnitine CoA-transferase CaiB-like acyl-CoA transferase